MKKILFAIGILGALAVILGAFGAHALVPKLPAESLASYKTGVLYHFIHILAALIASILYLLTKNKLFRTSAYIFLIGILLFSGSIYLLSTRSITHLEISWLGPVTPVGGVLFILGWICLAIAGFGSEVKWAPNQEQEA